MTDLAAHRRAVLRPHRHGSRPGRAHRRRGARRHGRRRAVPRIQPVRERSRSTTAASRSRLVRPEPGLRPARRCRARRAAMPMPRSCPRRRSAAPATRCARCKTGQRRQLRRAAARHQPPALYRRSIRSAPVDFARQDQAAGRDRRLCPRARIRACARSRPRSSGVWQAVQIIRPDGTRVADIRPLVRLNVSIVVGDGDRMETRLVGRRRPASPISAISRSRELAARRSTRRCARRWSISARCRRRPAR